MTVVAVGSLAGAPGATSLVMALARQVHGRVLVIEADPDGGCLAAREDLAVRPGLTDLAATCRLGLDDPEEIWHYAQPAAGGVPVVVAHPGADAVVAALRAASSPLASALSRLGAAAVFVDVGRYRQGSPALPLAAAADRRLVVSRPTLDALALLAHRSPLLDGLGKHTVVSVGHRPYRAKEVERVTQRPVVALPAQAEGRWTARRYHAAVARLVADLFGGDREGPPSDGDVERSGRPEIAAE
jgi:hypothetical protein